MNYSLSVHSPGKEKDRWKKETISLTLLLVEVENVNSRLNFFWQYYGLCLCIASCLMNFNFYSSVFLWTLTQISRRPTSIHILYMRDISSSHGIT